MGHAKYMDHALSGTSTAPAQDGDNESLSYEGHTFLPMDGEKGEGKEHRSKETKVHIENEHERPATTGRSLQEPDGSSFHEENEVGDRVNLIKEDKSQDQTHERGRDVLLGAAGGATGAAVLAGATAMLISENQEENGRNERHSDTNEERPPSSHYGQDEAAYSDEAHHMAREGSGLDNVAYEENHLDTDSRTSLLNHEGTNNVIAPVVVNEVNQERDEVIDRYNDNNDDNTRPVSAEEQVQNFQESMGDGQSDTAEHRAYSGFSNAEEDRRQSSYSQNSQYAPRAAMIASTSQEDDTIRDDERMSTVRDDERETFEEVSAVSAHHVESEPVRFDDIYDENRRSLTQDARGDVGSLHESFAVEEVTYNQDQGLDDNEMDGFEDVVQRNSGTEYDHHFEQPTNIQQEVEMNDETRYSHNAPNEIHELSNNDPEHIEVTESDFVHESNPLDQTHSNLEEFQDNDQRLLQELHEIDQKDSVGEVSHVERDVTEHVRNEEGDIEKTIYSDTDENDSGNEGRVLAAVALGGPMVGRKFRKRRKGRTPLFGSPVQGEEHGEEHVEEVKEKQVEEVEMSDVEPTSPAVVPVKESKKEKKLREQEEKRIKKEKERELKENKKKGKKKKEDKDVEDHSTIVPTIIPVVSSSPDVEEDNSEKKKSKKEKESKKKNKKEKRDKIENEEDENRDEGTHDEDDTFVGAAAIPVIASDKESKKEKKEKKSKKEKESKKKSKKKENEEVKSDNEIEEIDPSENRFEEEHTVTETTGTPIIAASKDSKKEKKSKKEKESKKKKKEKEKTDEKEEIDVISPATGVEIHDQDENLQEDMEIKSKDSKKEKKKSWFGFGKSKNTPSDEEDDNGMLKAAIPVAGAAGLGAVTAAVIGSIDNNEDQKDDNVHMVQREVEPERFRSVQDEIQDSSNIQESHNFSDEQLTGYEERQVDQEDNLVEATAVPIVSASKDSKKEKKEKKSKKEKDSKKKKKDKKDREEGEEGLVGTSGFSSGEEHHPEEDYEKQFDGNEEEKTGGSTKSKKKSWFGFGKSKQESAKEEESNVLSTIAPVAGAAGLGAVTAAVIGSIDNNEDQKDDNVHMVQREVEPERFRSAQDEIQDSSNIQESHNFSDEQLTGYEERQVDQEDNLVEATAVPIVSASKDSKKEKKEKKSKKEKDSKKKKKDKKDREEGEEGLVGTSGFSSGEEHHLEEDYEKQFDGNDEEKTGGSTKSKKKSWFGFGKSKQESAKEEESNVLSTIAPVAGAAGLGAVTAAVIGSIDNNEDQKDDNVHMVQREVEPERFRSAQDEIQDSSNIQESHNFSDEQLTGYEERQVDQEDNLVEATAVPIVSASKDSKKEKKEKKSKKEKDSKKKKKDKKDREEGEEGLVGTSGFSSGEEHHPEEDYEKQFDGNEEEKTGGSTKSKKKSWFGFGKSKQESAKEEESNVLSTIAPVAGAAGLGAVTAAVIGSIDNNEDQKDDNVHMVQREVEPERFRSAQDEIQDSSNIQESHNFSDEQLTGYEERQVDQEDNLVEATAVPIVSASKDSKKEKKEKKSKKEKDSKKKKKDKKDREEGEEGLVGTSGFSSGEEHHPEEDYEKQFDGNEEEKTGGSTKSKKKSWFGFGKSKQESAKEEESNVLSTIAPVAGAAGLGAVTAAVIGSIDNNEDQKDDNVHMVQREVEPERFRSVQDEIQDSSNIQESHNFSDEQLTGYEERQVDQEDNLVEATAVPIVSASKDSKKEKKSKKGKDSKKKSKKSKEGEQDEEIAATHAFSSGEEYHERVDVGENEGEEEEVKGRDSKKDKKKSWFGFGKSKKESSNEEEHNVLSTVAPIAGATALGAVTTAVITNSEEENEHERNIEDVMQHEALPTEMDEENAFVVHQEDVERIRSVPQDMDYSSQADVATGMIENDEMRMEQNTSEHEDTVVTGVPIIATSKDSKKDKKEKKSKKEKDSKKKSKKDKEKEAEAEKQGTDEIEHEHRESSYIETSENKGSKKDKKKKKDKDSKKKKKDMEETEEIRSSALSSGEEYKHENDQYHQNDEELSKQDSKKEKKKSWFGFGKSKRSSENNEDSNILSTVAPVAGAVGLGAVTTALITSNGDEKENEYEQSDQNVLSEQRSSVNEAHYPGEATVVSDEIETERLHSIQPEIEDSAMVNQRVTSLTHAEGDSDSLIIAGSPGPRARSSPVLYEEDEYQDSSFGAIGGAADEKKEIFTKDDEGYQTYDQDGDSSARDGHPDRDSSAEQRDLIEHEHTEEFNDDLESKDIDQRRSGAEFGQNEDDNYNAFPSVAAAGRLSGVEDKRSSQHHYEEDTYNHEVEDSNDIERRSGSEFNQNEDDHYNAFSSVAAAGRLSGVEDKRSSQHHYEEETYSHGVEDNNDIERRRSGSEFNQNEDDQEKRGSQQYHYEETDRQEGGDRNSNYDSHHEPEMSEQGYNENNQEDKRDYENQWEGHEVQKEMVQPVMAASGGDFTSELGQFRPTEDESGEEDFSVSKAILADIREKRNIKSPSITDAKNVDEENDGTLFDELHTVLRSKKKEERESGEISYDVDDEKYGDKLAKANEHLNEEYNISEFSVKARASIFEKITKETGEDVKPPNFASVFVSQSYLEKTGPGSSVFTRSNSKTSDMVSEPDEWAPKKTSAPTVPPEHLELEKIANAARSNFKQSAVAQAEQIPDKESDVEDSHAESTKGSISNGGLQVFDRSDDSYYDEPVDAIKSSDRLSGDYKGSDYTNYDHSDKNRLSGSHGSLNSATVNGHTLPGTSEGEPGHHLTNGHNGVITDEDEGHHSTDNPEDFPAAGTYDPDSTGHMTDLRKTKDLQLHENMGGNVEEQMVF